MSGIHVEIAEQGVLKAMGDLERVGVRAADVRPLWAELDGIFHADEARRFGEQGPGWQQLAQATEENKARLGQPDRILVATGVLERSLTAAATGLGDSTFDALRFGTDVDYARFHQFGTSKMPVREVVGLSPEAIEAMAQVVKTYIGGLP